MRGGGARRASVAWLTPGGFSPACKCQARTIAPLRCLPPRPPAGLPCPPPSQPLNRPLSVNSSCWLPCSPLPPRQVGFLYLRYVCDPRKLWGWFKQYMHDEEVGR